MDEIPNQEYYCFNLDIIENFLQISILQFLESLNFVSFIGIKIILIDEAEFILVSTLKTRIEIMDVSMNNDQEY